MEGSKIAATELSLYSLYEVIEKPPSDIGLFHLTVIEEELSKERMYGAIGGFSGELPVAKFKWTPSLNNSQFLLCNFSW